MHGQGYVGERVELRCDICQEELIEYDKLRDMMREQDKQQKTKDQANWYSFLSFGTVSEDGESLAVDYDEDNEKMVHIKSFILYRCGHRYHRACVYSTLSN